MVNHTPSPWANPARLGAEMVSDYSPVLIVGQIGSLPVECAREIHIATGGGNFERISCTPDASALRIQVAGLPADFDLEIPLVDSEPPNNAINRSFGGTLYLEFIDRCHPSDVAWIQMLLSRQTSEVNGHSLRLDPSTRVIASITVNLLEGIEFELPNWLRPPFAGRVVTIEPLGNRPADIIAAIEWFSHQAKQESQRIEVGWSTEARDFLVDHQWPGGHEELRDVVRSLIVAAPGKMISLDTCKEVFAQYDRPGMRALDIFRRQQCIDYSHGLQYMGRSISASEIYNWVGQFSMVASGRPFDPWDVGLRIVGAIHNKYYYSSDRLRILIREAYGELCNELAEKGFIQDWSPSELNPLPTTLQALLVNPLGPIKSSAAVLPHMAHLLGAGSRQVVAPAEEVGRILKRNKDIRLIFFCDDFTGTGQQILTNLIHALASDPTLKDVCESRSIAGRPVALGAVLGVGFANALSRIRNSGPSWLPVFAHAGEELGQSDRAFSVRSSIFPESALRDWSKDLIVNRVGSSLYPSQPGGFGNLQALVVTADNAPNDTLPVIWRSGDVQGVRWRALFERASSPSS